jgi:hypothetical protein
MRPISTYVHGTMDYAMGVLLILLPFWLGLETGSAGHSVLMYMGIGLITYSLLTNYELGLTGIISMPAHLTLDFLGGLFLAASPWIFNFHDVVYLPHLILGALEVGAAALTDRHPIRVH